MEINILENELKEHGIIINNINSFIINDKNYSFNEICSYLYNRACSNEDYVIKCINDLHLNINNNFNIKSSIEKDDVFIFISSLKYIYTLLCSLKNVDNGRISTIKKTIKNILSSDIKDINNTVSSLIIEYKIAIEWLNHLIIKDKYCLYLLKYYKNNSNNKKTTFARGVAGPWSRLDLPMRERVFEWKEVAEETYGRSNDKRNQRRYKMGLENLNEPGVNEGFYWRELRNEPYAFDDESSNPYPHRNLLWSS